MIDDNPFPGNFIAVGLVPLAGPWIQLGITQDAGYDGWAPWLIIDGILQAGAMTFIVLGFVLAKQVAASADLGNGVDLAVSPGIGSLSTSFTF